MSRTPAASPIVLNGRYELGQLIAEGGMAHVFRGRDRVLDRDVAIKILRAQYAASPEFLDRFRREARLAASLAHPYLVNVFDVGQDAERHYIVMELLPGQTLKDLTTRGPLTLEEAIGLCRQVALGMALAHRRGLVHRDLKPQNILISEEGDAKVADFGLAQASETTQLTMPGTVWGTVQYISPEQAQGMRPDARSDVYALGAIFYELLTGQPPYVADTPAAVMMKHVYEPVPDVLESNPSLPPSADWVIQKAMAKEAGERFQSMDEFAQALADLRDNAGAETMPIRAIPGDRAPAGGLRRPTRPAAEEQTQAIGAAPPRVSPRRDAGSPAVYVPRHKRQTSRLPLVLAGSVLAFFALMAVGALLARAMLGPRTNLARATATVAIVPTPTAAPTVVPPVPVPSLVGLPIAQAQDRLAAAGLTWETVEDFSNDTPLGSVAAQDPAPNTPQARDKPVKLTVSKGPQKVSVPNVIGDPFTTASDKLTKAGLAVERQDEFTKIAAPGVVFDQAPRGGDAPAGSTVTLKVSKGPDQVVVPEVIKLPEAAARDLLAKTGLQADVSYEPFPGVDPGVVFAQDPPTNAQVDRGATVKIKVRRDPTPAPPTPTVPPPPATATAVPPTVVPTTAPTAVPTRPVGSTPSPQPTVRR